MKTIKFILFIALLAFSQMLNSNALNAQTTNRELGLRLTASRGSDFVFKKEKQEGKFKRLRVGLTDLGYSEDFRFGLVFGIGIEKRKEIKDQLHFIHGFEPSLSISSRNDNSAARVGLGYILGFQYDVTPNFSANVEAIPFVGANVNRDDGSFIADLGINSSAAIGLIYRFQKSK
ncbi:hypothetical protein [Roseivirga sp. E12]|uniref:hypothetical protein n=1 Tax=Roseivirga sp. E12 TaxID=2819237 RepID=UPI001ABD167D|nr:hypothetical protein [Roseivirga sp. E12]MBO3698702.1 hypothetical protein [Roseivirga sp. E12]